MKILFVTPYLASPPGFGAQRRLDGLMRGLAERHTVDLLSFAPGAPSAIEEAAAREYLRELHTIDKRFLDIPIREKRIGQLASLVSFDSYETRILKDTRFQRKLHDLVVTRGYDVVQIEFSQLGFYDARPPGVVPPLVVLDEHNIEYQLTERTAKNATSLDRRVYAELNFRKVKREEITAWRKSDGVVLTSGADEKTLLADLPTARTKVVPNAVDLEAFRPEPGDVDENRILFFGAMNYHPTIDGVTYFVEEILPKLSAKRPGVVFEVIGQNPPPEIKALARENVLITGFVDDPRPYLERASAIVVPLRVGGGTRFKIVEAMAKGRPIISTTIGAEGLDVVDRKELLLADDAETFAAKTAEILADPSLGRFLGENARARAEASYGWGAAVGKLEEFFTLLASERGASREKSA